jgi:hypothetical protein
MLTGQSDLRVKNPANFAGIIPAPQFAGGDLQMCVEAWRSAETWGNWDPRSSHPMRLAVTHTKGHRYFNIII